jgi:hypothetical protein
MRSQIWKLLRRITELKLGLRAGGVGSHAKRSPFTRLEQRPPAELGVGGGNCNSHILFLAGDVAALQHLLRCEINRPVRAKNLRFGSRLHPTREQHALAVMLSLKQSVDGNLRQIARRSTGDPDQHRVPFFSWKH